MNALDISARIGDKNHLYLVTTPEKAALLINPSSIVGMSGFTPSGYPKAVPLALAKRIEKEHFKIQVFTGASVGDELDGALVRAGGIADVTRIKVIMTYEVKLILEILPTLTCI